MAAGCGPYNGGNIPPPLPAGAAPEEDRIRMQLPCDVHVALIRHGRTDWNVQGRLQGRTDIPLNAAGRLDALRAAEALAAEAWHAVYTSPLARAYATAEIIGERLGLELQICGCLIERAYGKLEGSVRRGRRRRRTGRRRAAAGMESDVALAARAVGCMTDLARRHPGQRLVVVSHGGLIRMFLYRISHGRVGRGVTKLANGGITRLTWAPERSWRILSVNETAHLASPEGPTEP